MKIAEYIKELESRLRTSFEEKGLADEFDSGSDEAIEILRDETDTLCTDIEDGDWDDEDEEKDSE